MDSCVSLGKVAGDRKRRLKVQELCTTAHIKKPLEWAKQAHRKGAALVDEAVARERMFDRYHEGGKLLFNYFFQLELADVDPHYLQDVLLMLVNIFMFYLNFEMYGWPASTPVCLPQRLSACLDYCLPVSTTVCLSQLLFDLN